MSRVLFEGGPYIKKALVIYNLIIFGQIFVIPAIVYSDDSYENLRHFFFLLRHFFFFFFFFHPAWYAL